MSSTSRVLQTGSNQVTFPYQGNSSGQHHGIDIVKQWSQLDGIVAHSDGVVIGVRKDAKGFEPGGSYGNYVHIAHGGTYSTFYAHLSSVAVSVGQTVKKGQYIGYMGATGYAFGGHLHFEVRKNGVWQNPTPYINADLPGGEAKEDLVHCVAFSVEYYYRNNKWGWLPIVKSGKRPTDTIGNKGEHIGAVAVLSSGLRGYCVRNVGSKAFLPTVKGFNWNDPEHGYAGNGKPISDICIFDPTLAYRVKLGEKQIWLPTVYGKNANVNDFRNGFAGDGKNWIDEIEIWKV